MPFARCHSAGRIHYAERGDPRPDHHPFLLIHGAGASSAIWMMVMARLGRVGRALAIDLPGHGPSPAFERNPRPTLIDYRDATGELAAQTTLGPAVLVGHSMGALIAIEAALAWPDKVVALVLCGAAPRLPVSRALLATLENEQAYAHFPAWLAERALSPAAKPALKRAFLAAGVAAPRAVTQADFAAIDGADLGPRLEHVRCPIIWLDGADDGIVRMTGDVEHAGIVGEQSVETHAARPGEVRVLAGVGHLTPIEAPAEVAAAAIALTERRAV
jgi:pimeloyl-ACP methyl ester carboxylesterase